MVQFPVVSMVAVVVPLGMVQTLGVCEAKLTVRPELAVAVSASCVPTVWGAGLVKVMVCGWPLTVMFCGTIVAAAKVELPVCVAWIVQVPAATKIAAVGEVVETVQTLWVVEAKLTARPELAVAESVSGVPTV